jgi:hypothetical protein
MGRADGRNEVANCCGLLDMQLLNRSSGSGTKIKLRAR